MQINQPALNALTKGFRVIYEAAFQAGDPMYKGLVLEVPSTNKEEVYDWLGSIPGMKELVGEIQLGNLSAHGYTIRNKEWENTIEVKEIDISTDRLGIYNPLFASLGQVAAQHPDALVAGLLIGGFTTKCYTGKNFFDANHEPVAGGTKFSNKGTKKLSAANFDTARTNLKSRLNSAGRPMNLGRKLVLVVSPQNETLGKEILQADFIQANAAAVSNVRKGDATLEVWPQLASSPDMWFLLEIGYVMRPLIFQTHQVPRLNACNQPNDSHVILKHTFIYQAYGVYNAGYGLPEFAYGSTGADAA